MLEHEGNLGCIETGLGGREFANGSEVGEELSSLDELQHDVEVLGVLAYSIGFHIILKIEGVQDENFVFQVVDLFALNDLVLLELLENKVLFSSDILDEFDTSKGSLSQDS